MGQKNNNFNRRQRRNRNKNQQKIVPQAQRPPVDEEVKELPITINSDELCTICYCSELGSEPCTTLSCGHTFHTDCIVQLLTHKWTTLRISFAFMSCPSCKQEIKLTIQTPQSVAQELRPLLDLK